jgi:fatty-acyl-CoA synthase
MQASAMIPADRLSYTHGASDAPLLGETVGANLRRTVERFGEREALVVRHQNVRLTYRELWTLTARCARGLLARGVQKGDRVGIWSANRYEWVVLQFAAARIGAILVNINPAYKTAELEYALRQSGVSLLVLSRRFRQTDYVAMLAQVRDQCPVLREALVLDDDWDKLLDSGELVSEDALAAREALVEFDDPVNIQYTSGTTGAPKGVTLSHHNVLNNAFFGARQLQLTDPETRLTVARGLPGEQCTRG